MLTRLFLSLLHTTGAVLSVHALDVSNGRHSYVSNKRQEAPCTTDSCVCFAGAEITCLNTGSDAPIASDCSNLAIQILSAPEDSTFILEPGQSKTFSFAGGTCMFNFTNTGTSEVEECEFAVGALGGDAEAVHTCLDGSSSASGFVWQSVDSTLEWTLQTSRCDLPGCAPL